MALQATQKSPGLTGSPGHPGLDKGKKAVYQNRSWVRGRDPEPVDDSPDGSETGRPSLLSRLESPSLLKRIAPPAEVAAASSLAARLKNPPASIDTGVSEDYDEDVDMRDTEAPVPNGVQVKMEEIVAALPSPTRERRGWKTRGARPTIDVVSRIHPPRGIRGSNVVRRSLESRPDLSPRVNHKIYTKILQKKTRIVQPLNWIRCLSATPWWTPSLLI